MTSPRLEVRERKVTHEIAAMNQKEESPDGYSDPRAASLKSGAARWRLLFQVDSEDASGMMWGDVGRL